MIRILFGLLLVLGFLTGAQAQATKPAKVRLTTDGVELPAASERRVEFVTDGIGKAIGALPEDVAPRLFSAGKTREPLKSRSVALTDGAFYTLDKFNADVVEFQLEDGRVRMLRLHFKPARAQQVDEVAKSLFPNRGYVDVKDSRMSVVDPSQTPRVSLDIIGQKNRVIDVGLHPIEWYIVTKPDLTQSIAEALRARRLTRGMTIAEAEFVHGKGKIVEESRGRVVIEWKVPSDEGGVSSRGSIGGGGAQALQSGGEIRYRAMQAVFVDGKLDEFSR